MALALITGASSGIGLELAHIHAEAKGDVILVARSKDKLEALGQELENKHGIKAHIFVSDLSKDQAAEQLYADVKAAGLEVDYLVNNAGFGGHGLFHERDWTKDNEMIALNIRALTALTRAFLPDMVARKSGRVLNVASMAGFLPGPLQAVYYATKAYVVSFSQAINNELGGTGVTVTALCPGATDTGFLDVADLGGTSMKDMLVPARPVADVGYKAMLRAKPIAIPGFMNKLLAHVVIRLLPKNLIVKISRKTMEKA